MRILERSKAKSINSSLNMPKNGVASRAKWGQSHNWSWNGAKTGAYGYGYAYLASKAKNFAQSRETKPTNKIKSCLDMARNLVNAGAEESQSGAGVEPNKSRSGSIFRGWSSK